MKKILPFFLLGIFLFNAVGYVFFFKCVQHSIKDQMNALINSKEQKDLLELTIAKVDIHKIEWFDDGEEMRYEGRMYDIAKVKETKEGLTIYCINDEKEEALNITLADNVSNDQLPGGSHKKDNSVKKTEIKLYLNSDIRFAAESIAVLSTTKKEFINCLSVYPEITSPPPELG
jgi:hypothetical protein